MYNTANYLFATYLQINNYTIKKVEKIRPGKANFYFEITEEEAEELKMKFHSSCCMQFERIRKNTIELAY